MLVRVRERAQVRIEVEVADDVEEAVRAADAPVREIVSQPVDLAVEGVGLGVPRPIEMKAGARPCGTADADVVDETVAFRSHEGRSGISLGVEVERGLPPLGVAGHEVVQQGVHADGGDVGVPVQIVGVVEQPAEPDESVGACKVVLGNQTLGGLGGDEAFDLARRRQRRACLQHLTSTHHTDRQRRIERGMSADAGRIDIAPANSKTALGIVPRLCRLRMKSQCEDRRDHVLADDDVDAGRALGHPPLVTKA